MNHEMGLRVALAAILMGIISVQVRYHRVTGQKGNLDEMKRQPLLSGAVAIMGFFNMGWIAAYVALGDELLGWALLSLPAMARWAGVAVGVLGLLLFLRVHQVLGRSFSHTTRIRSDQELIVDGPYRFVQHPMYSAFSLLAIAFSLITANWVIGLCWLAGVSLLVFARLPREEEGLRARFGDAYAEFARGRARIIPGVW